MSATRVSVVARAFGEPFRGPSGATRAALPDDPTILSSDEGGFLVAFRFGATVAFGLSPDRERRLAEGLRAMVTLPERAVGSDEAEVEVDASGPEGVTSGVVRIRDLTPSRLAIVGNVLAKSAALAHREEQVAAVFEHIELLAAQLRDGHLPRSGRRIVARLGEALLIQTQTVGRVEVGEKPELTWDDPELDRLYERLAVEYELAERDHALTRKLELIATVTGTYLELLNNRRTLRVEWYIVILIVVELVVLLVYEMVRG